MMGIREVFCSEFQAMSKGSNSVFNGVSLSEGCKNYENPDRNGQDNNIIYKSLFYAPNR